MQLGPTARGVGAGIARNRCQAANVEIVAFFHTDFFISGLAALNDLVVLLAYVVDESGANGSKGSAERPELRILTRSKDELSSDALSMHGACNILYIYMYVCIYVCIYVCMYLCMFVCVCV